MDGDTGTVINQIKEDIHGIEVSVPPVCDYCNGAVSLGGPVQYEILRIGDLKNIKRAFNPPSTWIPDAVRCSGCEIEAINPATDGYDEALVELSLDETDRVLRIDSSNARLIEYSPHPDGYYPPNVNPVVMAQNQDLGFARWVRFRQMILRAQNDPTALEALEPYVRLSPEVPPSVAELFK